MASLNQPLRRVLRRPSSQLRHPVSSASQHVCTGCQLRSFTQTTPRPLRKRPTRTDNARRNALQALAADTDSNFSLNASNQDLFSMPESHKMVPREAPADVTEDDLGPTKRGFFASGATDDNEPDPEFDMDDISASAHGELEQVRELRELERVSGWDGPMLWQYRKEFQRPTEKTPLRFRYTTYLGEHHPAAKKVVMDFQPAQLPNLSKVQCDKLIKLLGTRYDPHSKTAKMACEQFQTAPQNKRHLITLLERLLTEAREGKDTFEDIPFDFRHARFEKPKLKFPKEWRVGEERKRYLEETWAKNRLAEQGREEQGRIADGKAAMGLPLEAMSEEPEMVVTQRRRHK
ncbi:MAG: hypothetical protein Q9162_004602 [Coniocarpon cinnabarinum]